MSDLDKLKHKDFTASSNANANAKSRDCGMCVLNYGTNSLQHFGIEWTDRDKKDSIQTFWELLHRYFNYARFKRSQHITHTLQQRCVLCVPASALRRSTADCASPAYLWLYYAYGSSRASGRAAGPG